MKCPTRPHASARMPVRSLKTILSKRLHDLRTDNSGAVVVLAAMLFPLVIGGMGLGAETGYWYLTQRKLQQVADVSAHAAAIRKLNGGDEAQMKAAALHIAAGSGFAAQAEAILVNNPPTEGDFTADESRVEVIIPQTQLRLFSAIFADDGAIEIRGRAVAKLFGDEASKACVLALSANAPGALTVTGSASVSLSGCDLASNSASESAFSMPNNAGSVSADCVYSAGGMAIANAGNLSTTCSHMRTHAPALKDPYADVPEPSLVTDGCQADSVVGQQNKKTTLSPTYNHASGMKAMCFAKGLTIRGDVTLEPGLYIIKGGDVEVDMASGGNSSMTGDGVVFFLQNASVKFNANLTTNLTAPTTGPYAGMLFFGSRADSHITHSFNGNADSSLQGAIYAPASRINVNGNSSSTNGCTQVIGNTITLSGNTSLAHDCGEAKTRDIMTAQVVRLVE